MLFGSFFDPLNLLSLTANNRGEIQYYLMGDWQKVIQLKAWKKIISGLG